MNLFKTLFSKLTNSISDISDQVTDIDGNTYGTIRIGSQTWMTENLRATRFNDGSPCPELKIDFLWESIFSPAFSWYNNNQLVYEKKYGALYNWYVTDPEKNKNKNICPPGWHIPSDDEWSVLVSFLEANPGKSINAAKSLSAPLTWRICDKPDTVGNNLPVNNSSGFIALPGGYRFSDGNFYGSEVNSFWWSSTKYDPYTNPLLEAMSAGSVNTDSVYRHGYAWGYSVFFDNNEIVRTNKLPTNAGLYIRCIRD